MSLMHCGTIETKCESEIGTLHKLLLTKIMVNKNISYAQYWSFYIICSMGLKAGNYDKGNMVKAAVGDFKGAQCNF